MLVQHPSHIFKFDFRPRVETENYRCLSVFDAQQPFGSLIAFDDETFAPQHQQEYTIEEEQTFVLLPLVGGMNIAFSNTSKFIHSNQIFAFTMKKGMSFSITNPYEEELVNFLQFRLTSKLPTTISKDFDLKTRNGLNSLVKTKNFTISVGIFDSRKEEEYTLKSGSKGIFTYVIKGAFEFQNRLLEDRDALSIWEIENIELESLVENSILLLLEIIE